jgi:hypothetical protein
MCSDGRRASIGCGYLRQLDKPQRGHSGLPSFLSFFLHAVRAFQRGKSGAGTGALAEHRSNMVVAARGAVVRLILFPDGGRGEQIELNAAFGICHSCGRGDACGFRLLQRRRPDGGTVRHTDRSRYRPDAVVCRRRRGGGNCWRAAGAMGAARGLGWHRLSRASHSPYSWQVRRLLLVRSLGSQKRFRLDPAACCGEITAPESRPPGPRPRRAFALGANLLKPNGSKRVKRGERVKRLKRTKRVKQ